jgi:hypothetical protein
MRGNECPGGAVPLGVLFVQSHLGTEIPREKGGGGGGRERKKDEIFCSALPMAPYASMPSPMKDSADSLSSLEKERKATSRASVLEEARVLGRCPRWCRECARHWP